MNALIEYTQANQLSVEEFKMVLINTNLILCVRDSAKLPGLAPSLSGFAYRTYLSGLAADQAYQKQGIGKKLVRPSKLAAPQAKLILLSVPVATAYYPRIGMSQHQFCYYLDDVKQIQ